MADGSRSTDFCSGDPTKFWKAATTACLPPRKRLLAGLKQNGWVSSSTSYLQKGCEASCTNEELKLEVDLGEEKHDCNGNTLCSEIPTQNEDESRAVEKVVTVKNKRAIKRRKSLSVLTDCHPARNLQHELSKSFSEVKIQDKIRTNRNSIGPLLDSRWEKESLDPYERAEAARAAAASAAKEAAKARAVALEKAASAAKAALVARNILEAVVLAAQSGTSEIHPSRKSWDSYEQNKVSKDVNCKSGSGSKPSDFPYVLANKDIDSFFEKRRRHKITFNDTSNLIMSRESEKEVGVVSTFVFDPLRGDVVSNSFNDRKHIDNSKTSVSTMHAANTKASSDINKDMEHAQLDKTMSPSCSRSPAFDDEKLARQLHRAMNSSPRISRSKACSDHSRKSETAVTPTGDCSHIKYRQARGGVHHS
ncbi:hypothetical protein KP509_04G065400 [Ceratopteris richardii]|uniref:Uncharacterized protein n=1 Tax=Ceratopteris richardii TaxID=49495 RepID=A0A8T2UW76_CERRI|nr:hypothetical protein KP509_04G065400 [Ceratopteris richardii]